MPRLAGTEPTVVATPPHTPSQKKLIVLVDMDMVLCDFESYFLEKYREKYPTEPYVPLEERCQFYIREQYATIRQDLSTEHQCTVLYCLLHIKFQSKAANWIVQHYFVTLLFCD
eukprot:XP_014782803.1 PREDICTED: 5'(3')-deoxyribonucleotidase, mitochondrial-like [Octopus bimaculoides]